MSCGKWERCYQVENQIRKFKKYIIVFVAILGIVCLTIPLLSIAAVVAAPLVTLDALKGWVTGFFDNGYNVDDWFTSIYPKFEPYGRYPDINVAAAISCYYFLETGEDINDVYLISDYVVNFDGSKTINQIYKKIETKTGIVFSMEDREKIKGLSDQIQATRKDTKNAKYIDTLGTPVAQPIEHAIAWLIDVANNPSCGYSQIRRLGNPDYDCSSLMAFAICSVGIDVAVGSTHTMIEQFEATGKFVWIPRWMLGDLSAINVNSGGTSLKRGDILLQTQSHTEMYLGGGMNIGAHCDEYGGIFGANVGDQTGNEISVTPYYDDNWEGVLRYIGD